MDSATDALPYTKIAPSTIAALLEKARTRNYHKYLSKVTLTRVRGFEGKIIRFDFPVTAIVGPNGGGKTTILGAAAIAYRSIKPRLYFAKSGKFDDSMKDWRIEYEIVDKDRDKTDTIRRTASFRQAKWNRDAPSRPTFVFGVSRTVPANERRELQRCVSNSFSIPDDRIDTLGPDAAAAVGRILGKDVSGFSVIRVDPQGRVQLLAGMTGDSTGYSEFHFGAGESSIIRMVSQIESSPDGSLILIEEIENGLHPIATAQMVGYLIEVATRKKCQVIFTTHSDDALLPLPPEAIWAAVDNQVYQGKLSIKSLRAISGQVPASLAIFTEDTFAAEWVTTILRKRGSELALDAIEVHSMKGDSIAVQATRNHNADPSRTFPAICVIDGDSEQTEDGTEVFRLPGVMPEATVFDGVMSRFDSCLARLSEALLVGVARQNDVRTLAEDVALRNHDRHTVFLDLGERLGLLPEHTVRDAFLSVWVDEFSDEADALVAALDGHLPQID